MCTTHSKPKCAACRKAQQGHRAGLSVNDCCLQHHTSDDRLPIKVCHAHSMTKCGRCVKLSSCCKNSHHACTVHQMYTCGKCKKLPGNQSLPNRCCKKGHHQNKKRKRSQTPDSNSDTVQDEDTSDDGSTSSSSCYFSESSSTLSRGIT